MTSSTPDGTNETTNGALNAGHAGATIGAGTAMIQVRPEAPTAAPDRLFPVGRVIYFEDLIGESDEDITDDPPTAPDDGDGGRRRSCVYDGGGYEDDDDCLTWRTDPEWLEPPCGEEPEYYITSRRSDPADPREETYYYCPRHFAVSIGFLCEQLGAQEPDDELDEFHDTGRLPPRMAILSWGRIDGNDMPDAGGTPGRA